MNRRGDLTSYDPVATLAFARGGHELVTGGWAESYQTPKPWGQVQVWSVAGRKLLRTLNSDAYVSSLAFAADGRTLVVGYDDGSIRRAAPARGEWLGAPLRGFPDPVTNLALSPDGKTAAAAGGITTTVRVWNLDDRPPSGRISGRATSPSSRWPHRCDRLRPWSRRRAGRPGAEGLPAEAPRGRGRFQRRRQDLVGVDTYGDLHLWNLQTRKLVKALPGNAASVNETLVTDPAGGVLIAGSGRIRFWDPAEAGATGASGEGSRCRQGVLHRRRPSARERWQ